MSDAGRRRKIRNSGDSEKLSEDSYEENDAVKGSEEEGELNASTEGTRESEYETVEGETETDDSTAIDNEDEDDDSVLIEYEREDGDGQESVPPKEKKLDDDEDRRNPQYIPKRGTFYEHDDRTAVEEVDGNEPNEKEAAERAVKEGQVNDARTKKVWREHDNRWNHDRYNEDEQAPKSRDELIAIYGYDIRNEEGPPRARRRRRYGRGPNKYTRNWEDEDAYNKPQIAVSTSRGIGGAGGRRGGRRGGGRQSNQIESHEDFPPLKSAAQGDNENTYNSINQNIAIQGTTYSNRTVGVKRNTKEDRNTKPQKDAFPPLEVESQQNRNSGAHEPATHKVQSHSANYKSNREENSSGNSNPSLNRKIHDNRDGPHIEIDRAFGRGKNRSYRGGKTGGPGMLEASVAMPGRSRGPARSSSETRTPGGMAQHHESNKGASNNIGPPPTHPVPSLAYHSGNRISQEEPTREFHRRNTRGNSGNHPQQPSMPQGVGVPSDRRQQAVVPPRMQQQQQQQQDSGSSNRPKRYSSLRQRSLPETGASYQQPTHAPAYYQPGTDLETVDTNSNRPKRYSAIHPVPGAVYPQPDPSSTYFQPAGYVTPQPVYGDTPQHPQSTGTPPLQLLAAHPNAPAYAAPFPSPPAQFVGPPPPRMLPTAAGAPPAYLPAPAPPPAPIINYVATPPTYTTFQGYTAVPAPGPPAELYHPQGGITYYNTEEQTIVPRPITQKRQRSAIPIVPPPERVPRGRGRSVNSREETPPGDKVQSVEELTVVNPVSSPSPPVTHYEDAENVPAANESLATTATVA